MAPPDDALFSRFLRTMRIMALAMIAGTLITLAILLSVRQVGKPPPDPPIVSYASLAIGLVCLALSLVVPNVLAQAACRRIAQGTWTTPPGGANLLATDVAKLWSVYQTRLIIGLALVETAALMLAIAYFAEGILACLVVALIAIVLLAMRVPTRSGVDRWVDTQMTWIEQERGTM
jgi:hypothetical protein